MVRADTIDEVVYTHHHVAADGEDCQFHTLQIGFNTEAFASFRTRSGGYGADLTAYHVTLADLYLLRDEVVTAIDSMTNKETS